MNDERLLMSDHEIYFQLRLTEDKWFRQVSYGHFQEPDVRELNNLRSLIFDEQMRRYHEKTGSFHKQLDEKVEKKREGRKGSGRLRRWRKGKAHPKSRSRSRSRSSSTSSLSSSSRGNQQKSSFWSFFHLGKGRIQWSEKRWEKRKMVTGQTDCQWKLSATQPVVVIDESKSLSAFLDSCPSPQLMEPMKVDEEPKEIRGTFVEELRLPERDVDPGSALIKSNSECVPFSPMPEMNMILSIKDIRERISQLALVKASRQLTLLNQPINSEDDSFYEDDERVLRKQGDEEAEDDYDDDDDDDEKPEKNCGRGGGFGDGDGCIHQTFELARIREELASLKPRSFSLSIRDFRFQPAKLSLGWLQLSGWESIDNGTRRTVKFLLICRKIKHGIAAWTRKIAAKFSSDKSEKKGKKSKKQKKAENNGSGGAAASAGAFFPKKERSSATLRPRKSTTSRRRRKRRDSMSRRKRQAAMYDRKGCLRRRRTWVNDFRPARPKSKSKKRQSSDEFLKAHRTYLTHELLRFQNIA